MRILVDFYHDDFNIELYFCLNFSINLAKWNVLYIFLCKMGGGKIEQPSIFTRVAIFIKYYIFCSWRRGCAQRSCGPACFQRE